MEGAESNSALCQNPSEAKASVRLLFVLNTALTLVRRLRASSVFSLAKNRGAEKKNA